MLTIYDVHLLGLTKPVFMIALLMGACASVNNKQISSYGNETGQVSAKGESENGETFVDQEIVCRKKVCTESRLKMNIYAAGIDLILGLLSGGGQFRVHIPY